MIDHIGILFWISLLAAYFIPTYVGRKKDNAWAIFLINLFFGWSVFGWAFALILAMWKDQPTYLPEKQENAQNNVIHTVNDFTNSRIVIFNRKE